MSRSDFYILAADDPQARRHFLCKILEKVYGLGHRIYVRTGDEASARQLDEWLWEFRGDAFLPHSLIAEQLDDVIEIGYGDSLPGHRDVFINLELEVTDAALSFDRIIEVVIQQPEILAATRANYRRYKLQGYDIRMNDMRPQQPR
ncbi:MAG: DNA polymerase-3 subunit chi [Motiliproteus sp.]|jgi:DNA polymerase-3 subunit chi